MANSIQEIAAVSNLPLIEQNPILSPSYDRITKQKVQGTDGNYFLKTASLNDLPLLIAEKIGLETLTVAGAVKVPKVFLRGKQQRALSLFVNILI